MGGGRREHHQFAENTLLTSAQNKPFRCSHYLFISQTYRLSPEEAAELESRAARSKRQKAAPTLKQNDIIPLHPEDEQIAKVSLTSLVYDTY